MPISDPDVEFILDNADGLITVTVRCVISFGLADGLNDRLLATPADRRDRAKVNAAVRDGLRLGPLRPAGLQDLYGVAKATE
jgi:hypothetical protein